MVAFVDPSMIGPDSKLMRLLVGRRGKAVSEGQRPSDVPLGFIPIPKPVIPNFEVGEMANRLRARRRLMNPRTEGGQVPRDVEMIPDSPAVAMPTPTPEATPATPGVVEGDIFGNEMEREQFSRNVALADQAAGLTPKFVAPDQFAIAPDPAQDAAPATSAEGPVAPDFFGTPEQQAAAREEAALTLARFQQSGSASPQTRAQGARREAQIRGEMAERQRQQEIAAAREAAQANEAQRIQRVNAIGAQFGIPNFADLPDKNKVDALVAAMEKQGAMGREELAVNQKRESDLNEFAVSMARLGLDERELGERVKEMASRIGLNQAKAQAAVMNAQSRQREAEISAAPRMTRTMEDVITEEGKVVSLGTTKRSEVAVPPPQPTMVAPSVQQTSVGDQNGDGVIDKRDRDISQLNRLLLENRNPLTGKKPLTDDQVARIKSRIGMLRLIK